MACRRSRVRIASAPLREKAATQEGGGLFGQTRPRRGSRRRPPIASKTIRVELLPVFAIARLGPRGQPAQARAKLLRVAGLRRTLGQARDQLGPLDGSQALGFLENVLKLGHAYHYIIHPGPRSTLFRR